MELCQVNWSTRQYPLHESNQLTTASQRLRNESLVIHCRKSTWIKAWTFCGHKNDQFEKSLLANERQDWFYFIWQRELSNSQFFILFSHN